MSKNVKKITIEEVEGFSWSFANEHLEWGEPIPKFGTRNPGVLEGCLNSPFQSLSGKDLYPSLLDKAAILFYLMIKDHPFQNGNKRIALLTLLLFLYKNGKWVEVDIETLYELTKIVAKSKPEEKNQVVKEIKGFIEEFIVKA